MPDIQAPLREVSSFINASPNRYAALCAAVVVLLSQVRLHGEDQQDMLSDVSDYLDGLKPPVRSGLPRKK